MNDDDARELAEELRLLARHETRWKPLLHRAARGLEVSAADRSAAQAKAEPKGKAPGRFGGRRYPPAFAKVEATPPPAQDALF